MDRERDDAGGAEHGDRQRERGTERTVSDVAGGDVRRRCVSSAAMRARPVSTNARSNNWNVTRRLKSPLPPGADQATVPAAMGTSTIVATRSASATSEGEGSGDPAVTGTAGVATSLGPRGGGATETPVGWRDVMRIKSAYWPPP